VRKTTSPHFGCSVVSFGEQSGKFRNPTKKTLIQFSAARRPKRRDGNQNRRVSLMRGKKKTSQGQAKGGGFWILLRGEYEGVEEGVYGVGPNVKEGEKKRGGKWQTILMNVK